MSFEPNYFNTWIIYAIFTYFCTICVYYTFQSILNTMDSNSHYPKKNTYKKFRKFDSYRNDN